MQKQVLKLPYQVAFSFKTNHYLSKKNKMYRDFTYDIYKSEKYDLYYADAWSDNSDQIIYSQGNTYAEAESNIKKEIEEYLDLFG